MIDRPCISRHTCPGSQPFNVVGSKGKFKHASRDGYLESLCNSCNGYEPEVEPIEKIIIEGGVPYNVFDPMKAEVKYLRTKAKELEVKVKELEAKHQPKKKYVIK